jgi:putative nucleotidyltransferase with HDIG domain
MRAKRAKQGNAGDAPERGKTKMAPETRILLVDDEPHILEVFSAMLRDKGYPTRTASHAEEALRLVAVERFDIAFIDHVLGPVRGLDLIPRMAELRPDLSHVLITGNGNVELAVQALKSGASDYVSKPFLLADLTRSIDYVNKKREQERRRRELLESLEHNVRERTEELKNVYFPVLSSLAHAMETRDRGTYGHSRRVSHNSELIAAALGLDPEERDNLKAAALLHDIGKIGTSDFILGKKGALTEEEKKIVRGHPQQGVEILRPLAGAFKQLGSILPAILHHHENFDGSGYPSGLAGEAIPLLARIITVADTYDAILSDRPYRCSQGHDQAMAELVHCAGSQFDPKIVDVYVKKAADGRQLFCTPESFPDLLHDIKTKP